jgi:hypothetical protein
MQEIGKKCGAVLLSVFPRACPVSCIHNPDQQQHRTATNLIVRTHRALRGGTRRMLRAVASSSAGAAPRPSGRPQAFRGVQPRASATATTSSVSEDSSLNRLKDFGYARWVVHAYPIPYIISPTGAWSQPLHACMPMGHAPHTRTRVPPPPHPASGLEEHFDWDAPIGKGTFGVVRTAINKVTKQVRACVRACACSASFA